MGIRVGWLDPEQRTIHVVLERGWTWHDLEQAIRQADSMIARAAHTVHLVIDIRNGGGIPGDFLKAAGQLFAQGEARSNEGQRVIVGAGRLIRAAYHSLTAVYGAQLADRPFLFASSLDEALRLVDQSTA